MTTLQQYRRTGSIAVAPVVDIILPSEDLEDRAWLLSVRAGINYRAPVAGQARIYQ